MITPSSPPRLAEALLRLLLPPRDRESVSGDLLEEYREDIHPLRGQAGADAWYWYQVLGFFFRSNAAPALMLFVAIIGRTAFDWLVPTSEFTMRATISTLTGASLLTVAGLLAGLRSHSVWAGTVAGVMIPLMIAPFVIAAITVMLILRHDVEIMNAIRASGGLSEAFTLPILLAIPGAILGTMGGMVSIGVRRVL